MPYRYEVYARLEPAQPIEDLNRGFRAEIHDPVWFLGKQWQMGEFQGEDASSVVAATYVASQQPIDLDPGTPGIDPRIIPPEAIIESEPQDWWTPGRRIRIGKEVSDSPSFSVPPDPVLMLSKLPTPYSQFNGNGYDGRELYIRRSGLGLADALFSEVPQTIKKDNWISKELSYFADFTCAGVSLNVERHSGGTVDWYTVDADCTTSAGSATDCAMPSAVRPEVEVFPTRLSYPGAPQPRWWQIEDAHVDIGGFPPDRSHFPTMLLIDLIVSHSDDWFYFPVIASAGHVITIHKVVVRDSFGGEWDVNPPTDWSLFKVKKLDRRSLVIWPKVATPITGPSIEEVVLGINEDANLLWAVERRLEGSDTPTPSRTDAISASSPSRQSVASEHKEYDYRPSTSVFPHWHPYEIDDTGEKRLLGQGRLADLSTSPPRLTDEPKAKLLTKPDQSVHKIIPSALRSLGLRVERCYVLGRCTDGSPVLWIQRRRSPLISPPALRLRFDVLEDS